MVICLELGADLHTAQLMPLPLTVSCFSKIQVGFTFLVPAYPGSPGKRAVKRVGVCVCAADRNVARLVSSVNRRSKLTVHAAARVNQAYKSSCETNQGQF